MFDYEITLQYRISYSVKTVLNRHSTHLVLIILDCIELNQRSNALLLLLWVELNFCAALEFRINGANILNLRLFINEVGRFLWRILFSELVVISCSCSDYFELRVSDILGEAAGVVVAVTANLFACLFFCRILSCVHIRSVCLQACDSLCRRRCVFFFFSGLSILKFLQSLPSTGCFKGHQTDTDVNCVVSGALRPRKQNNH